MEEYRFHAFESALLYKENGNDAKVQVKFIPCLVTHFDTPHSVIIDRETHFQSIFKTVFKLTRIAHLLIIAYHPHASSLQEVKNHELELSWFLERRWINLWGIGQSSSMRLIGPFELPSRLLSIGTLTCRLFNCKSCHLSVNHEHKPLWAMKRLNMDASVTSL